MTKYFYTLVILLLSVAVKAQFTAVTHLSGSATYGSHTVGVTSAGTASNISYCGASPYWIGAGTGSVPDPGSYTFTFSPAVNAVRVTVNAANTDESITVEINGVHYSFTAGNLFTWAGSCGEPPMVLSGDTIIAPAGGSGHAVGFNIYQCGITSIKVATNGLMNGSVFNMTFSDTAICSNIYNNGPVCLNDTLKLDASELSGSSFLWTGPNGFTSTLQNPMKAPVMYSDTGIYRLIYNGTDTFYTHFTTRANPDVKAASNAPVCDGDALNLTATTAYPGVLYSWRGPAGFTSNTQNPTIPVATLTYNGKFYVEADSGGCKASDSIDVVIKPLPIVDANNTSPVCVYGRVQLQANSSLAATYLWSGPSGFTSTLQNPLIPMISPGQDGVYTVVATANGCSASTTTSIAISPNPTLNISYILSGAVASSSNTINIVAYGGSVQFQASGAKLYTWTPNDGSLDDPNINNPVARPQVSTRYTVTGMNEYGCRDTASMYVDVLHDDNFVIPSAFSPNNDGKNDVFKVPQRPGFKLAEFNVYNRWGELVFHSEDIRRGWDGTFNGVEQDMGVYTYVILYSAASGAYKTVKGSVTLIR